MAMLGAGAWGAPSAQATAVDPSRGGAALLPRRLPGQRGVAGARGRDVPGERAPLGEAPAGEEGAVPQARCVVGRALGNSSCS